MVNNPVKEDDAYRRANVDNVGVVWGTRMIKGRIWSTNDECSFASKLKCSDIGSNMCKENVVWIRHEGFSRVRLEGSSTFDGEVSVFDYMNRM